MATQSELVDLVATREPESTAQEGIVVVTVPVVFSRSPDVAGQVRLALNIHQAEYLAAQLQPVIVTAKRNARRTR